MKILESEKVHNEDGEIMLVHGKGQSVPHGHLVYFQLDKVRAYGSGATPGTEITIRNDEVIGHVPDYFMRAV